MTPLLDRSCAVCLGDTSKPPVTIIPLNRLTEYDHLSRDFNPPVGHTAGEIFKYLVFLQKRKYGKTILDVMPNQQMHVRHIKKLLEKYDPLIIKRAIKHATVRCERPFSCKLVKIYCGVVLKFMEYEHGERILRR